MTNSVIVSVADPGCLSRIQKQQQKRGMKENLLSYLFCSHKNHKIKNDINFELVKKNFWANLQRIIELSTQKIVIQLSKIWFGIQDPRSGKKPIPDPVSWSSARNYRPCFRENQPKRSFSMK
jgi:hypothetical protein